MHMHHAPCTCKYTFLATSQAPRPQQDRTEQDRTGQDRTTPDRQDMTRNTARGARPGSVHSSSSSRTHHPCGVCRHPHHRRSRRRRRRRHRQILGTSPAPSAGHPPSTRPLSHAREVPGTAHDVSCTKRRASSQCLPFSHAPITALRLSTSGLPYRL